MRQIRCPQFRWTPFHCALFCVVGMTVAGCAGTRYPTWDPSGNLQQQRNQAVRYDPYPDNDIGPKVDGGRPPSYSQQLPETVRARWTQ